MSMRWFPDDNLLESELVSLGMVEVCYQQSSSILTFQDLEDEALSSELVPIQLPDSGHALHVVIKHHLSVQCFWLSFLREALFHLDNLFHLLLSLLRQISAQFWDCDSSLLTRLAQASNHISSHCGDQLCTPRHKQWLGVEEHFGRPLKLSGFFSSLFCSLQLNTRYQ